MSTRMIQDRLNTYQSKTQLEEQNALKEITQDIALSGLSRAGFFKQACFMGGTCLRILHGLNRFSEDLDFSLLKETADFEWLPFLISVQGELAAYGYQIHIQDRSESARAVKVGFLKDDSIGKILILKHRSGQPSKSIKIKFEIDTKPPIGATTEQKYIDFPVVVPVLTHDLSSLFAGKTHALLCRRWEKGRDWFDFNWYVSRKVLMNTTYLSNALDQQGPWQGKRLQIDHAWIIEQLREKIINTHWAAQIRDVNRFVRQEDQDLVSQWSTDFFLARLEALTRYSRT